MTYPNLIIEVFDNIKIGIEDNISFIPKISLVDAVFYLTYNNIDRVGNITTNFTKKNLSKIIDMKKHICIDVQV